MAARGAEGSTHTTHWKGLGVTIAGVVVISPDSLLIRLVGVDAWTLSLWRGALLALTLSLVQLLRHRSGILSAYRGIGRLGLLAGLLSGVSTVFFVGAVTHTTAANVLIIVGAVPLIAALLGRVFLGEAVPLRTWIAIILALGGIGLAVGGGATGPRPGDLLACGTVLCMSGYLTVLRAAGHLDMTPCIVFSGVVAAALAGPFASPLAVPSASVGYLLLLCVVVIPVSFTLITLGPRYLPAHEVALICLLEMVLGPYLVWIVLGENPGWHALVGGCVVLAVLTAHTFASVRGGASAPAAARPEGSQAPLRRDAPPP